MSDKPVDPARVVDAVDWLVETPDLVGLVLEMFDLLPDLAMTELSTPAREVLELLVDASNDQRRARLTQGRLI